MISSEYLTVLDIWLTAMLVTHVFRQVYIARSRLRLVKRLTTKKKTPHFFKILCNSLLGPDRMTGPKMTASVCMYFSFILLALHGSLFGFYGIIVMTFIAGVKLYYLLTCKANLA